VAVIDAITYNKRYTNWQVERAQQFETIARLDAERQFLYNAAVYLGERADAFKKQRDTVAEELVASREQIQEEMIGITELPPSDLAVEAARLLEMVESEVRVSDFGLEFSLAASQRTVQALAWLDWHWRVERPKIVFTLSLYKQENEILRAQGVLFKETITLMEEEIRLYAEQAVKDADMVKRAHRRANLRLLKGVLGTVVVGGVIYVIVTEVIIPILRR